MNTAQMKLLHKENNCYNNTINCNSALISSNNENCPIGKSKSQRNHSNRKKNHSNNNNSSTKNQNIYSSKNRTNLLNSKKIDSVVVKNIKLSPNCNELNENKNNIKKIAYSMAMHNNSTPNNSKTTYQQQQHQQQQQQRQHRQHQLQQHQSNNNIPATTSVSAPVSPASYSLDFLHSVGVQMTASCGGNLNNFHNQVIPPYTAIPSPQPLQMVYFHNSLNNNYNPVGNYQRTYRDDMSCYSDTPNVNYNNKDYRQDYPVPSNQRMNQYYQNQEFHNMNQPYHFYQNLNNNFNGNQVHQNHIIGNHPRFHQMNQNHPIQSQLNQKKNPNQANNKKTSNNNAANFSHNNNNHNNNNNNNNNNNVNNNNNNNNINSINFNSNLNINNLSPLSTSTANSTKSLKNYQNYSNLTYVSTDGKNCSEKKLSNNKDLKENRIGASHSKCDSPNLQFRNNINNNRTVNNNEDDSNELKATNSDFNSNTISSTSCNQSSVPDDSNTPLSLNTTDHSNDYETDSSHSNYKRIDCSVNNDEQDQDQQILSTFHINEIVDSAIFCDDDAQNNPTKYYGAQPNIPYWDLNGIHSIFNPYSIDSCNFLNDANRNIPLGAKKNHNQNTRGSFRNRRHLYTSVRSHSFHESLYTPPDKFLAKAHLIEIKEPPSVLLNGSKWDKLSQDIWTKFVSSQQTVDTYKKKLHLWRYLYVIIKKSYPRYGLYLVGSTISGYGADTSDVDMCLVSRTSASIEPRMEALFNLTLLKHYLVSLGVFDNFNLIEAKVPILRFKDSTHMLEVDLNFNNCVGIRNTHLLHCYSQIDWRLKPLVLITKLWAQYHNINNAKNMTISSYSLVLMVIHFLQCGCSPPVLPCLHELYPDKFQIILKSNDFGIIDMNEELPPYDSQNTQTIGELLLQYLEYYSNFDYGQYAISVRTGSVLPIDICRQAKSIKNDIYQWKELCIEEPFDLTNTARSVYDVETFERIKAIYGACYNILRDSLDVNSIFVPVMQTTNPYSSAKAPAPVIIP